MAVRLVRDQANALEQRWCASRAMSGRMMSDRRARKYVRNPRMVCADTGNSHIRPPNVKAMTSRPSDDECVVWDP